jgi:hypothetical protein
MTTTAAQRSILVLGLALSPLAAWSQVSIAVTIAPPPLPLYAQPPIPDDGYIWTPGYWAWDPNTGDYIWVPGTWVLPPAEGLLWTPGYWGWVNGGYMWHRGYWGHHVGYYGGINYGYGYIGSGYVGGRWDRGHFRYNTAVNNVPSGRVHNVYRAPVPQRPSHPESFNGGPSHYRAAPTASERRFEAAPHREPTQEQSEHEHRSMAMPEQRMGNNHGRPPTAATPRPGGFGDPQVEHVRQAPEPHTRQAPEMHVQPVHANPGMARPEGNPGGGHPQGQPGGHPGERAGERPGEHRGHPEGDRR